MSALRALHPAASDPIPALPEDAPRIQVDTEVLASLVRKRVVNGSSPAYSGWTGSSYLPLLMILTVSMDWRQSWKTSSMGQWMTLLGLSYWVVVSLQVPSLRVVFDPLQWANRFISWLDSMPSTLSVQSLHH